MKKGLTIVLVILFAVILQACDTLLTPGEETNKNFNIEPFERLFDDSKVKTLNVKITQEKWDELDLKMVEYYDRFEHYRTDYMIEGELEYSDDEGSITIKDIGFRTRGNYSRDRIQNDVGHLNPNNFKLSFHEDYDPVNVDRTVFELEEIDLKYNRNWDSTYLTEKYSLDLFQSIGVFAAETTLVRLIITIGDEEHYYGVYTAFEPIDDNFIKRRLTKEESQGNLYKSLWQMYGPANLGYPITSGAIGMKSEATNYRPAYDLKTNKKNPNHDTLRQFIKDINQKDGSEFETYIEANFDVDMFLKYLAVGVLLGNPDDYRAMGNNYYLYQNSKTNKWMIIPYDYDHGLGQGWDGDPVFTNWTIGANIYTWGNLNSHQLGVENYPHVLVDKILNIPTYQVQYEAYLAQLIDINQGDFNTTSFMLLYNEQHTLYDHLIEGAMIPQRFGLRNVIDYIEGKRSDIDGQLSYYVDHPNERGF
ncbi:MAG: CotH kinase family protein [Acholeplasmataceae bacterium]|jgi:spore coat protein CotH|nr:CotH kinase family protein [Acholeplasmataceae bacterium]